MEKAIADSKINLGNFKGTIPFSLGEEIERTAREVFGKVIPSTRFMPSGSACLQASRREGGALSLFSKLKMPTKSDSVFKTSLTSHGEVKTGSLRALNQAVEDWRTTEYKALYDRVLKSLTVWRNGVNPSFDVKFVGLYEPGKIRPISIGDGYIYSALQPLQGFMLTRWKNSRHSTMLHDDLLEKVRELDAAVNEECWCSGDYKSATDLLKKDASLAAFSVLEGHSLYQLGFMSLSVGRVVYPDGTVISQCEGQLMGHPLSFPLLCVINLAVYRRALRKWLLVDRKSRLDRYWKMYNNVIVNGDDILFKCPRDFAPIFYETAFEAGFVISQGKNYLSPDACLINSQLYIRVNGLMVRRGYLNLKLIKGSSLKSGDSTASPDQLGKDIGKMCENCPWAVSAIPTAFKRFEGEWSGKFFKPNWFLPVHLGGYGVPLQFAPLDLKITRAQREIAARFVHDPRMALYRTKGISLPTAQYAGAIANWRMIPGDYVRSAGELTVDEMNDGWLGKLAYAVRASTGSSEKTTDARFISTFRPQFRLKPMSIEGLERYWNAQVFAFDCPPCPPLGYIKVPQVYNSKESYYQIDLLDDGRKYAFKELNLTYHPSDWSDHVPLFAR